MSCINLARRIAQIEREQETKLEREARASDVCPACGSDKPTGQLVCFTCFKVEAPNTAVPPLKWAGMPFSDWLDAARLTPYVEAEEQTSP